MLRRRSQAGRVRSRQSCGELEIADEVDAARGRGMIHRDMDSRIFLSPSTDSHRFWILVWSRAVR
jgi:hypothetical protein